MKASERPSNYERPQDQYPEFERAIKEYFREKVKNQTKLYRVRDDRLWLIYLENLPEDGRFVYDCRACRQFIEKYGGLVTITDDGTVESALWGAKVPEYFADAVEFMEDYVTRRISIEDVFFSDVKVLGTPEAGGWTHLHVELPSGMWGLSRTKNAEQLMAEKREERQMLLRALHEYPVNVVEQAVALLNTDSMYRGANVLGIAEWFLNVHKSLEEKSAVAKNNLIWKAVGEAPTGFCHIKSSMIGTLLDDIVAGYSTRVIIARFEEKMNPQNYMRSQTAPTAAAIEQAEKLVEKLGIADSLRRRYARFDEVIDRCLWMPSEDVIDVTPVTGKAHGVFSHLTPKDVAPSNDIFLDLPTTTMTWAKFSKTILPTAAKLEVKIDNPNRFMALVTEVVPGSENILQWDNPFSWYYHGGIDGEMKRRVEAAGGRYENCEIRCSLMWDSYTEWDLHCKTPSGGHIYYGNKRDRFGGFLDVDANGGRPTTTSPVENIRWASNAPNGHYEFWVHNYCNRVRPVINPCKIEVEVGGKIYSFEAVLNGTDDSRQICEFDYRNGEVKNFKSNLSGTTSNSEVWSLTMNDFVKVNGILKSPNIWNRDDALTNDYMDNHHTFFLLDGCKDTSEGKGRGFFNEILKPELREIRKTLELYSASTPIECAEEADACGVGFTDNGEWNVTFRVTSNGNSRLIKIDRFD